HNLDSFDLPLYDWCRIYYETLLLSSNFFKNLNSHISHIWQIIIPQKLGLTREDTKTIINSMQPPSIKTLNHELYKTLTSLQYYMWLLNEKSYNDFNSDQEYYQFLHRQLTIVTSATAWHLYTCNKKYQKKVIHQGKLNKINNIDINKKSEINTQKSNKLLLLQNENLNNKENKEVEEIDNSKENFMNE